MTGLSHGPLIFTQAVKMQFCVPFLEQHAPGGIKNAVVWIKIPIVKLGIFIHC
jgi:hypothetical protein